MEMSVEHLLPGNGAVGEGEVDALAAQVRSSQGDGQASRDGEHLLAVGFVEVGEAGGVGLRDSEEMARVDRVQVTEGENLIVLIGDAGFFGAGDDLTEQAAHR